MKKYSIILAVVMFGVCGAFADEGEAFGGGFFSGDDGSLQGELGSMDEALNSAFLKGTGTQSDPYTWEDDFGPDEYGPSPGPNGRFWLKLTGTDGGFKPGDYIQMPDEYGVVHLYVLKQDPSVPYPYLMAVMPDTYGPPVGGLLPYFRMPVGNAMLPLLLMLSVFAGIKRKRKRESRL